VLRPGGAFLPERADWLVVPVIKTRDSGPLATSNFECAWSRIEDASVADDLQSCESHSFNHWGPGWFEVILVRPAANARRKHSGSKTSCPTIPVWTKTTTAPANGKPSATCGARCPSVREPASYANAERGSAAWTWEPQHICRTT